MAAERTRRRRTEYMKEPPEGAIVKTREDLLAEEGALDVDDGAADFEANRRLSDAVETLLPIPDETLKAAADALITGTGVTQDGAHVPAKDFYAAVADAAGPPTEDPPLGPPRIVMAPPVHGHLLSDPNSALYQKPIAGLNEIDPDDKDAQIEHLKMLVVTRDDRIEHLEREHKRLVRERHDPRRK